VGEDAPVVVRGIGMGIEVDDPIEPGRRTSATAVALDQGIE
jgi:hypothetical protein